MSGILKLRQEDNVSIIDGYSLPGRLVYEGSPINILEKNYRCPPEGSFIGYKIAASGHYYDGDIGIFLGNYSIVKLRIPEDAKRSSAISGYGAKCRCNKAEVLDIFDINNRSKKYSAAVSLYDKRFLYIVGERVVVDDFCEYRFKECAPGIHFFMSSFEAMAYLILNQ